MKKLFSSLPFRLIVGLAIGILLGQLFGAGAMKVVVSVQYILGQLITFCVPLIVIGFIAPSITRMGSNASKMLGVAVIIAYASSVCAAFMSTAAGYGLIPHLSIATDIEGLKELPEVVFQLNIPQIMPVMAALAFSLLIGLAAALINLLIGKQIDFLTESSAFRTIYIASGIWQDAGWGCIIYLATLSNVDTSLYEAAKVDGASMFQRIMNVDVPALLPMAILNLIMSAGSLMNVGFEKVWLLQTDLNKATSDVIAVYVYQQGIENAKYSYSTAVGLFNTAVNLILLFIVNTIASKTSEVNFV